MPYGMSYASYRGDPFLGGLIRKARRLVGGVARTIGGAVPGPGGAILRAAGSVVRGSPAAQPRAPSGSMAGMLRAYSGGTTPTRAAAPAGVQGPGMSATGKKRRRMNYGNVRALRRADRRIDGFVGVARKALRHTNYKVVSKGSGNRKRDLGAGHVHVR